MGILSWLVVGLIASFIGSKVVNRSGEGLVRDVILGVIGAVVGDAIFTELGLVGSHRREPDEYRGSCDRRDSCARSLSFAYEPARPCMKF
jgi:uncharacterized membrane protein YeaQ/YmgE (transglycosylase-associated protein family)